jgi:hypothetical protein
VQPMHALIGANVIACAELGCGVGHRTLPSATEEGYGAQYVIAASEGLLAC